MKNLRKILGVITVLGFTTTAGLTTVACNKETSKQTDISGKIKGNQNIGQLTAATVDAFKAALQNTLTTIKGIETITTADYDVYKAGGKDDIQANDLSGTSLKVHIVAKGTNFKGEVNNVNTDFQQPATDISKKITGDQNIGQLTEATVDAFKAALQNTLKTIKGIETITTADYDVYKAGGTDKINDSDLSGTSLKVHIVAKGKNFKGDVDNVNTDFQQPATDISDKIKGDQNIGQLTEATVDAFKAALQNTLVKIETLKTITTTDYDVYKAGGTDKINDSDLSGTTLKVHIVAKGTNFKGEVNNVNTVFQQPATDISDKIKGDQNIGQLTEATVDAFKAALQNTLKTIKGIETITTADYDVYKAGGTDKINNSDLNGTTLKVHIVAKGTNFKGEVNNVNTVFQQPATDISDKIKGDQNIGQLTATTVDAFKAALQNTLKTIKGIETITTADYDVYKAGGTDKINNSDLNGTTLKVHIVAKGTNFKGEVNNVNTDFQQPATDISKKITGDQNIGQLTATTVDAFKAALQNTLKTIKGIETITTADYDVYKAGGTDKINNSDLNGTTLKVHIVAKGTNFKGEVNNVNTDFQQPATDISDKIKGDQNIGQLTATTVDAFKAALQNTLKTIKGIETITTADYDVYKAGGTDKINNSDLNGTTLKVHIVAKGTNFKGEVNNIKIVFKLPA